MSYIKKGRRLLQGTFAEWKRHEISLLSSALAYATVFSLAPLMILVIMAMGLIFGEDTAQEQIVEQLSALMGDQGAEFLATAITNLRAQAEQGTVALLVNIGFFMFGASNVFAQIQNALDRIWEVKPNPRRHVFHFLRKRMLSVAMLLVVVFLLLVSNIFTTALAAVMANLNEWIPGLGYLWQVLQWVLGFGLITAIFAAIYTILPDANVHWQDTWIGAIITTILFLLGQWLFGIFLNFVDFESGYGVAGSFLVIISWVFYTAQILYTGAAFTEVYARRHGQRITPSDFAVSTRSEDQTQSADAEGKPFH
jgi:membrane protein